jgi:hypothetical protein
MTIPVVCTEYVSGYVQEDTYNELLIYSLVTNESVRAAV